jgi:hypothetical protein
LSRDSAAQKPPQPGQDLSGFPTVVSDREEKIRAHTTGNGPWYFAPGPGGRFGLQSPRGTNYFADDLFTAVRERLGDLVSDGQPIFVDQAESMTVSTVVLPAGLNFANVTDKNAALHHVTRELCAGDDYEVTQAWAEAIADADFDGIRYASRFTTEPGPNSWALFGSEGPDDDLEVIASKEVDGVTACLAAEVPVLYAGPKSNFRIVQQ